MYQRLSSRLTRDTVGVAVVGDAVVDVTAGRAGARALIDQLLLEQRVRVAHVHLLVDHHAELADLLDVAVLARVEGQALPPDGRVALCEPHDVARHQELAGLVPDGDVHAGGAVGHFERSNFAVLFGDGRVANLQNDKHYVDVLLARADVLYLHVIHRGNPPRIAYMHTYMYSHPHPHTHPPLTQVRARTGRIERSREQRFSLGAVPHRATSVPRVTRSTTTTTTP